MADVVVDSVDSGVTREQVSAIARDPELRRLKPGSNEYQAAFSKKFGNNDSKSTGSAPAASANKAETKEVSSQTEASTGDSGEDADLPTRAQKRIAKLTAERNLEKAENAKLAARIAELEKAGKTPAQAEKQATKEVQAQPTGGFDKPKPKLGDFKSLEDFNDAYFDWKTEKTEFERSQKTKVKEQTETHAKSYNAFLEKGKEVAKENGLEEGEFKTLIENDEVRKYPDTVREILDSPYSAKIAFELANLSEDEKSKFSNLSPSKQIAYVAKLDAKFEGLKQKAETPKAISAAKAPGKPLRSGTGSGIPTQITSGMTFKEFEAVRKAQRPDLFRR